MATYRISLDSHKYNKRIMNYLPVEMRDTNNNNDKNIKFSITKL